MIDVAGRRETGLMKLLDDLKETRGCWKFEETMLDFTLWGNRFERRCGPVVSDWVNE